MQAIHTFDFEYEGRKFRASIHDDNDMGAPWDNEDGHGPVSDWTARDKKPGERVLSEDRGSKRFYDWQAACKMARGDGWNTKPFDAPNRIERAVQADFDRLQAWCNDAWSYIGVAVQALDDEGETIGNEYAYALWGIESDVEDYHKEVAKELAGDLLADEQRKTFPVL